MAESNPLGYRIQLVHKAIQSLIMNRLN